MGWKGCCGGWTSVALLCVVPLIPAQQTSGQAAWKQAVAARADFENEPVGQHTRAEYAEVMDRFRVIYHGDPASLWAPRAVDAVAALLAEQGNELKDRKSLRDAAGQYEFLARGYPQSSLAGAGLGKALQLLGPDAANDAGEAARVRATLQEQYPRSAAAGQASDTDALVVQRPAHAAVAGSGAGSGLDHGPEEGATSAKLAGKALPVDAVDNQRHLPGAAPAMVTGIRHWSTSSYTRVAIDLGGEVEYQAARVEHPDRIFFDLHGAKLAPGLLGKSFAITDDGFLKTIRAGQFGADVTRIVLDVQPVAQYSAFLLPNPTRLIIDIHGKAPAEVAGSAAGSAKAESAGTAPGPSAASAAREPLPAPIERPRVSAGRSGVAEPSSSLPPMPVTDGSAGFGLPVRRGELVAASAPVPRPRVVVSAKPTTMHPVPNTVASVVPETSREVAAVSEEPGVIAASAAPTSQPVVDRARAPRPASTERSRPAGTGAAMAADSPAEPPAPVANGQRTLMRALGLKIGRIVIDAGHGGHDSGTLGVDGIEEKDVVLDVALRLGKLLHDRLGAEIVYTRADDTFIPLETRTAIANKAQADLFISVHANSSQDPSARGVEVYYLNFTSDPEAMQVASRENAVSSQRVNQLSDLVKKIALKDKIDESRELATDVDASLYAGLKKGNEGLKNRGVKKAPFVVLIGANMPSILAEISFVTNPDDADQLNRPAYRERVAESLYTGVARYEEGINGVPGGRNQTQRTERAALKQGTASRE